MKIFNLPDLGEGLAEAEIREWYVKKGDTVKTEQPLVAVETAKALVDVPSPFTGKIATLHGQVGDIIKTGAPLVSFTDEQAENRPDSGTVVGSIEVGQRILREEPAGVMAATTTAGPQIKAAPAVRALAKALQVDLTAVTPSGPERSITLDDVKNAAEKPMTPPAPVLGEPLRGARRAMATAMPVAHREVVPVTLMEDANIAHWPRETDFTVRFVHCIAAACHAEPALNAHYEGKSMSRQLFNEVNVGLAVDTQEGLYVPVLKNVNARDDADLRATIDHFKELAQKQAFPLELLHGATITLTNFGTIAGRYANPIIMPPTVAIIGIGRAGDKVIAINGKPEVRKMLPLSLTFDHRAVTGGEATRFLAALISNLEQSAAT